MANNQIALRISGTKERQAGFNPLVMSGVLPKAEEAGLDRPLTGCNGIGFVVKHTPTYSLYMAIDGKVRSFDTPAPGVLTVAIVIPAGMKLAEGSPYTLLNELYNLFVTYHMTESDDGRHVYKNETADVEPFKSILSRYPLEQTSVSRISMNPAGPTGRINLSPDKMQEFFKDSFYPEFQNFKDIEIGDGLMTSPELSNVKIPRPIIYKIFVNGKQQGEVDSKDVARRIIIRGDRTNIYYYDDCEFSIGDLINHRGYIKENGAEIRLDPSKERIDCNTQRRYFPYALKVVYGKNNDSKTLLTTWLSNGKLRLLTEDTTVYPPAYSDISKGVFKGKQTFEYTELDKLRFKAEPIKIDGYKITVPVRGEIDREKRQVILKIEVKKEVTQTANTAINSYQKNVTQGPNVSYLPGGGANKQLNSQTAYSNDIQPAVPNTIGKEKDKREAKMALIFGILIGLLIGFVIGFYVQKYCFTHEPTKEQIEEIKEKYKEELMQEVKIPMGPTDNSVIDETVDSNLGNNGEATDNLSEDAIAAAEKLAAERAAAEKLAAERAAAEKLAAERAIILFNRGYLEDFGKLCDANQSLTKYKEDGIAIIKTLFTAKNNPMLEGALIEAGYLNGKKQRGDKSKIKKLDDLKNIRIEIENIKQDINK